MKTSLRLGLYVAGLAVLFGGTAAVSDVVVPDDLVQDRKADAGDADHDEKQPDAVTDAAGGLSLEQNGYMLSDLTAPGRTGSEGTLSFRITAEDGKAVTEYETSHTKKLHLIVVRTDGEQFRHRHPKLNSDGVWSLPWTWDKAGAYRVYADFTPSDTAEKPDVTVSGLVEVAGAFTPQAETETSRTDSVGGYDVELTGELKAGADSELTVEVTRDGEPVKTLEPYLGAFGHLVALREGDLAYLHVHPEGDEPREGERSGPTVTFATQAPTSGRYLLYLDFQVDGEVHTATFAVDAGESAPDAGEDDTEPEPEPESESDGHGH